MNVRNRWFHAERKEGKGREDKGKKVQKQREAREWMGRAEKKREGKTEEGRKGGKVTGARGSIRPGKKM